MTNPDNIVRVRARNGGRASVYEANGWAQGFSVGLLEGNGVTQNTSADMNVLVGGSTTKPDVLIAENAAGYKIALDVVGQQAIAITAPATNSRISSIVAYTDDLSLGTTEDNVTGSPSSCGLIVVNGTAAVNPTAPNDTAIRSAITADGATGSQASYCVIANITVESTTTVITNSLISTNVAKIGSNNIDLTTLINNPKFIQTGVISNVTFQANNSAGGFTDELFATSFDNIPIVVASGSVGTGMVGGVSVTSVTKTKFTWLARQATSTASTGNQIRWIAIDIIALGIAPNV